MLWTSIFLNIALDINNSPNIGSQNKTALRASDVVGFFCLFFCCYETRKPLLRLPPWDRSKPPGSISIGLPSVLPISSGYTTVQNHCSEPVHVPSEVNTLLIDGWARIPGLTQAPHRGILSHRIVSQDPPRLIPLSANTQGSLIP